jgi:hypothetical protein
MNKIIRRYTLSDGFDLGTESPTCEYCSKSPDETEIQLAYVSDTYICGDIECWNDYCFEWVWQGNTVEVEEVEIEEEELQNDEN